MFSHNKHYKYCSRKVVYNGIKFDSELEKNRYIYLLDLERKGVISDIKLQVSFTIIPTQTSTIERIGKNGKNLKPKIVVVERETRYVADFVYSMNGREIIEDTKGFKTPDYLIKRKLMRLQGHPIYEVKKKNQPLPE